MFECSNVRMFECLNDFDFPTFVNLKHCSELGIKENYNVFEMRFDLTF